MDREETSNSGDQFIMVVGETGKIGKSIGVRFHWTFYILRFFFFPLRFLNQANEYVTI